MKVRIENAHGYGALTKVIDETTGADLTRQLLIGRIDIAILPDKPVTAQMDITPMLSILAEGAFVYPEALRTALADYAHQTWSNWMQYLFDKSSRNSDGSVTIPADLVERWDRQTQTAYADLPPNEQASDVAEADAIATILARQFPSEPS